MADYYEKRRVHAIKTVNAVNSFVDSLRVLLNLREERQKFVEDYQAGDFVADPELRHLTTGMIGTLFDFVVPSIKNNVDDATNDGRNRQILLQIKK